MPNLELTLTPIVSAPAAPLTIKHNNTHVYEYATGKNEFTNEIGWRPITLPEFDPVNSIMAVHDILEHFPGDEYQPHNEYQAQGAMFWLRHEGKYFPKEGGPTSSVVIKPAFGMLFHHIHHKKLPTNVCPFVTEAVVPLRNAKTELAMINTVINAHRYANAEFKLPVVKADALTATEVEILEEARSRLIDSLSHALGWMRIGYRRAELRFKGLDKDRLVTLYLETQKSMDKLLPVATASPKSVLKVKIDYLAYSAIVQLGDSIAA